MMDDAWAHRDNVYVEDGDLVIRTRWPTEHERSDPTTSHVESFTGAVSTRTTKSFPPGRLCVSARLPGDASKTSSGGNQGLWPAHWLGDAASEYNHRRPLGRHTQHDIPHVVILGAVIHVRLPSELEARRIGAQGAAARAEGVLGVEILLADGGIAKGASGRPFAMAVLESLEQSVAAVTASVAGHEMLQKLNRLADADPHHVGLVEARLH